MSQCLSHGTLDVGENAQVLLGAAAELGAASSQFERPPKFLPRRLDLAALEFETRERIQGFRSQNGVAQIIGNLVATLAQLASQRRLMPLVLDNPQPAQRLRQDCGLGSRSAASMAALYHCTASTMQPLRS